jgi:hypothetical protein
LSDISVKALNPLQALNQLKALNPVMALNPLKALHQCFSSFKLPLGLFGVNELSPAHAGNDSKHRFAADYRMMKALSVDRQG